MKNLILSAVIVSSALVATGAGASDAGVIRTFEKDGKISFVVSDNVTALTPDGVVLPAAAGAPHGCNGRNHYPAMSLRMHQTGSVTLSMTILPDGHISNVALVNPNRFVMLNDESLACVKSWAYTPARRNGQPVEVQHTVEIIWRIGTGKLPG